MAIHNENHEITLKFKSTEELQKAYRELLAKGYNVTSVSDFDYYTKPEVIMACGTYYSTR